MTKIYPYVKTVDDIPENDILMIMDCDHMVKTEVFMKMGACMLDPKVGVTLIPQARPRARRPVLRCSLHQACAGMFCACRHWHHPHTSNA
jgi:cellulose synthase/poly-beta-1,6-N-acetylglucosamine synthase-like glycosyltransferase